MHPNEIVFLVFGVLFALMVCSIFGFAVFQAHSNLPEEKHRAPRIWLYPAVRWKRYGDIASYRATYGHMARVAVYEDLLVVIFFTRRGVFTPDQVKQKWNMGRKTVLKVVENGEESTITFVLPLKKSRKLQQALKDWGSARRKS